MKVSKDLWIEKGVRRSSIRAIKQNKKSRQKVYVLCTSYHQDALFEVVESRFISSRYEHSSVLAITLTKTKAFERVYLLINALYNEQTTSYESLQAE
ncbi:hypothetical protein CS063_07030 [Sporanaerobium hydrogeniformans]|uniref:Uncharacterized protein n=1 Tax=Sporanaerobium hydrogeniformans TaxID=3072179 RepID=A0AC61DE35_9FIRM|nr:hypothetical protein [Sporanaerobium hydrogeniformans]PHV71078.1 hypothetical protein CS063_07030 [Sporanaerobium hydrogeniformans]